MSHQLCECCCTLECECMCEREAEWHVGEMGLRTKEWNWTSWCLGPGRRRLSHCICWSLLEDFGLWKFLLKILKKNHKGFSSPSLEHGLISAGCSDILAITRLSLSIGNIHIASQCLSERLKEQFIQITRGDGSHIPSFPMVPTVQQNLLLFDLIWDFCCQLVCRSCYQFSIFLCKLLML